MFNGTLVSAKAAKDVRQDVNSLLRSDTNFIDSHLLLSLIETSLVRHGLTQHTADHAHCGLIASLSTDLVTNHSMDSNFQWRGRVCILTAPGVTNRGKTLI